MNRNGKPTGALRAALYARVSSGEQERQATIESQIDSITTLAADRGWQGLDLYPDNPASGMTLERRELDRLRADAEAGKFDVLVAYDLDRIARKYVWREVVLEDMRRLHIDIAFCTTAVDDSPEGKMLSGMQGLFAEYERAKILDRTRRGMIYKVKKGHVWRSRPPFGYTYIPPAEKGHRGRIEILPEEAIWVGRMFAWIARDGKATRWVADELTRQGVPTKHGGRWKGNSILNMLHNPIYAGQAAWGRTKGAVPQSPKERYRKRVNSSHVATAPDQWIVAEVPAIIGAELQAQALAALSRNMTTAKRNTHRQYLLQGLLYCGHPNLEAPGQPCGRKLMSEFDHGYGVYRCTRQYRDPADPHKHACCKGRVPCSTIEPLVWDRLVALLQEPELLLRQMAEAQEAQVGERGRATHELEAALGGLEQAQAALDRLEERVIKGLVDDATYGRLLPKLRAERDAARERSDAAQGAYRGLAAQTARWADVRAYCASVALELADLERPERFEARQRLVRTLIQRIVVEPGTVRIVGVLPCVDSPGGDEGELRPYHHRHQVALLEGKTLDGAAGDRRYYLLAADVDHHLGHDRVRLNALDRPRELVARAQLHCHCPFTGDLLVHP